MAKKAEATLVVKVVTKGQEALKTVNDKFMAMKDDIITGAKAITVGLAAFSAGVVKLATDAGKFDQVREAFEKLAASQGKDADTMLNRMKQLTEGMVSEFDLMTKANEAILLGLPIDRLDEMLQIAKSSAEATGKSLDFMLNSLVVGLGRQSKLMLDNLGIIVDIDKAYNDFAETNKIVGRELTETEKKQAFINEAMAIGIDNAEKMTSSGNNVNKQWQQTKATFENTAIAIGKELMPVAETLLKWTKSIIESGADIANSGFITFALNESAKAAGFLITTLKDMWLELQIGIENAKWLKSTLLFNKEDADASLQEIKRLRKERENLFIEYNNTVEEIEANTRKKITKDTVEEDKRKAVELEKITKESAEKRAEIEKREKAKLAKDEDERFQKELEKYEKEQIRVRKEIDAFEQKAWDEKQKREEEEREKREEAEEEYRDLVNQSILTSTELLTGGFESFTKAALSQFADTFLPGVGGAVGQMFDLLAQDGDSFSQSLAQMFSTEFLDNIAQNIPVMFETVADKFPDFVEKLIEVLLENSPKMYLAFTKAISNPKFAEALVLAFANGFANGIRDGLKDIGDELKKIFKIELPGGGGKSTKGKGLIRETLGFAQGGLVPGGHVQKFADGGTVDTVPAMLSPGEFVVNREATQANFGLLKNLNSGGGGGGNVININVNGGLMGDEQQAREFARAIDSELLKLRRENESLVFDQAIF